MEHRYPKIWQWVERNLGSMLTLLCLLLSIGAVYGRLCASLDQLSEINKAQDSRLMKLETIYNYAHQVDINTKRIDKLEVHMVESQKDRAAMNAKLDAIHSIAQELLRMHVKP